MGNPLRTFMLQYLAASSTSEAASLHLYDCVVATNCFSFHNLLEFLELLNLDFFPLTLAICSYIVHVTSCTPFFGLFLLHINL